MEPGTEIALIVGIGASISALSPVLLAYTTNKQHRRDREEDRLERETVATRAANVAKELKDVQKTTLAVTKDNAVAAAVSAADAKTQLKQIHTLVNSNLTAARQSELNQTKLLLVAMKRVMAYDSELGRDTSPEDLAAVEAAISHIAGLEQLLAQGKGQLDAVEQEADTAAAAAAAAAAATTGR